MWIKKDNNFTICDRYIKIIDDDAVKEPRFAIYKYTDDHTVDFENILEKWKKINWKLIELYEKEKEFEWKKYTIYGFIFEDDDWLFNITVSKKIMWSWINRLITSKTFNLEISVFDSPSTDGSKIYRNFGIWEDWQVLNKKLDKEALNKLVVESKNAAGEKQWDFSLQEKTLKELFDELKTKLENMWKLTPEEAEKKFEDGLEIVKKDIDPVKQKMIDDDDLPF